MCVLRSLSLQFFLFADNCQSVVVEFENDALRAERVLFCHFLLGVCETDAILERAKTRGIYLCSGLRVGEDFHCLLYILTRIGSGGIFIIDLILLFNARLVDLRLQKEMLILLENGYRVFYRVFVKV